MSPEQIPERSVHLRFQIDTNRINAKQNLLFMNQIEQWWFDEVIELGMSEIAMTETWKGNNAARIKKTMGRTYSITYATTPDEQHKMQQITDVLFPNCVLTQNQKNDVEIVFNAKKYHYTLITADGGSKTQPGGILGNRKKIKEAIGLEILTDEEAVSLIRKKITYRDNRAKSIAEKTGAKLPDWVGKD